MTTVAKPQAQQVESETVVIDGKTFKKMSKSQWQALQEAGFGVTLPDGQELTETKALELGILAGAGGGGGNYSKRQLALIKEYNGAFGNKYRDKGSKVSVTSAAIICDGLLAKVIFYHPGSDAFERFHGRGKKVAETVPSEDTESVEAESAEGMS